MMRKGLLPFFLALIVGCSEQGPTTSQGDRTFSEDVASATCVRTPFGNRPQSATHHVAPGNTIGVSDGRVQELTSTGELVTDYGTVADLAASVATSPCLTSTQPFSQPMTSDGIRPTFGSGWITYAKWDRPTGQAIKHDSADWIVPAAPATSNSQVVFLFNGIQQDSSILQPVLQWGTAADGGGAYYTENCWYLLGASTWYGTPVTVSPGDPIYAGVDSATGGTNRYTCKFDAPPSGSQTMVVYGTIPELTEAVETLEAYGITACSDYPSTTLEAMSDISIVTHAGTPTLSWAVVNRITDCHQKTIIASSANPGGEVDLYFRYPPPTVGISGPGEIDTKGTYTWTAGASGGDGTYTYQWVYREDGGSDVTSGTSSTQSRTIYSGDPNFWWIVSVTSAGMTAKDSVYVYDCIGNPGCGIQ